MDYRIFPPEEILETSVTVPPSKSIVARAMILNHMAGRREFVGDCDDTVVLAAILNAGLPTDGSSVNVGHAGTAMRFLTALCAATAGTDCLLEGSERMHKRPIGHLVGVLRTLGADIEYAGKEGFPPLRIRGRKLAGGSVEIDATESSQYVSALMMVSSLLEAPLTIRLLGNVQSMPYITMTAEMMSRRGAVVDFNRDRIEIDCSAGIKEGDESEADWSAATFWYEIAAVAAGWVTVGGLSEDSLQGDRKVAEIFSHIGVNTEFNGSDAELVPDPDLYGFLNADLTDMPDTVPALAVTCCLIGVPFRFTGVGALHDKECDRIEALRSELAKLGCMLDTENYGTTLVWDGRRVPVTAMPEFDTYGDHRMAMALAPVSVFVPGIVVRNAEVVAKSYPGFWTQLESAGFRLADPSDPLPEIEQ